MYRSSSTGTFTSYNTMSYVDRDNSSINSSYSKMPYLALLNIALLIVASVFSMAALILYARQNNYRHHSLPVTSSSQPLSATSNTDKYKSTRQRHRFGITGLSFNTVCLALIGNLFVMGIRRYQSNVNTNLLSYSIASFVLDIVFLFPAIIVSWCIQYFDHWSTADKKILFLLNSSFKFFCLAIVAEFFFQLNVWDFSFGNEKDQTVFIRFLSAGVLLYSTSIAR
ncbi:hypothetical protein BDF19DRAFT_442961 [Syncephalis fuscata]|nr:hypothetical protein BDF19DRAFT_442961 [Syncephalis fuscata]